jgi:hypothetical protein
MPTDLLLESLLSQLESAQKADANGQVDQYRGCLRNALETSRELKKRQQDVPPARRPINLDGPAEAFRKLDQG